MRPSDGRRLRGGPAWLNRPGSEPYDPDNLLDRHSRQETLEHHYALMQRRERELVDRRLGLSAGRVLSVGAGWHPGRHLFPAPAFELVAADADPAKVAGLLQTGRADEAVVGYAGRLGLPPRSFDVVLYRLVLHHIAYKEPLAPCFAEAASLLVPGGALVVIEPGLWHPVGAALAVANRVGLGARRPRHAGRCPAVSPPAARRGACRRAATRAARRDLLRGGACHRPLQRAVGALDRPLGSRTVSARFGHTLMLIARSASRA